MAELVTNCPRCGAKRITFDVKSAIKTGYYYNWQNWYEAFCICRNCNRSTVFVLSESVNGNYDYLHRTGLINISGGVNEFVDVESFIALKDLAKFCPPEHVPDFIAAIFREAASCLAIECYNASGTMFRLCVDLSTLHLLPQEDSQNLSNGIRRNLARRLSWLLENGILSSELRDLSGCIREDGNDAAHAGNLSKDDAHDLLDFTTLLLQRLFTDPAKLKLAQERRDKRRDPN